MRRYIIKLLLVLAFLPLTVHAQEGSIEGVDSVEMGMSRFDRRVNHIRRYWASLIPTQFVLQNAGNMGLISTE